MKSYGYEQNQNTCLTKKPSGNIYECHGIKTCVNIIF